MTSSNGNIFRVTGLCAGNSPVPGEFPAQRPVTRSFDVFFDLRLNKRLSKQSWGWWFETPSCPIWRHRNEAHFPTSWAVENIPRSVINIVINSFTATHTYRCTVCKLSTRNTIYVISTYHKLEDIILDIAEMVTIGEVRRVTEDDGRFGDTESVSHGVMGHVGQVHQHAYAVHLLHHDLQIYIVTSCHGNAPRITGPLWGESSSHRGICCAHRKPFWYKKVCPGVSRTPYHYKIRIYITEFSTLIRQFPYIEMPRQCMRCNSNALNNTWLISTSISLSSSISFHTPNHTPTHSLTHSLTHSTEGEIERERENYQITKLLDYIPRNWIHFCRKISCCWYIYIYMIFDL